MRATNISDFRANIKEYVDCVINDSSALIINRGNTAAVLISLDEYNSIKETERTVSSPALSHELDTCIEELKSGKAIEIDIDEL